MFPFRSVWNEDYDGDEIVQPTLDIPVIGRAQGLAFMTTSHRDLPKKTEKTKPVQKEIRRNQRLETRRQRKIPYKR
jgi:hypothetical protein